MALPTGSISGSDVETSQTNPHQPVSQTWRVLSGEGDVVWEKNGRHPLWTWWPALEPGLCHLLAGAEDFDIPTTDPANPSEPEVCTQSGRCPCSRYPAGCRDPRARAALRKRPFYVYPRDGRSRAQARTCGQHESYYYKAWGCETTGDAWWKPSSSWDLIQVKREASGDEPPLSQDYCQSKPKTDMTLWYGSGPCTAFACNPLNITFTQTGKASRDWIKGRLWGLRVYHQTAYDPGVLFKIRLMINVDPQLVGPNKVLQDQRAPPPKKNKRVPLRQDPPPNPTHQTPPHFPTDHSGCCRSHTTWVKGTIDRPG
uniref:Envelope glycoprotein n=1 Tax=Peromyscus maniculatus bairdii TaxID=230844 RepID=A0A8C8UL22_PERMB